ncbi:hypothetical protein FO519_008326 [Halicephalobus sp. NKZ332]|nr:hypothetical protein FO519_008326 [Halicephalobus sp. NKZ332]
MECIRRCYGYRFCYSVTYDHMRIKPCIFYLHTRDDCGSTSLVNINSIEYNGSPVSVSCLKCGDALPENEKQKPPEVDFNEDAQPESVPSNPEPVHDHSEWSPVVGQQRKCPQNTHEIVFNTVNKINDHSRILMINETTAKTPEDCASICFENHCDFAQFEIQTKICAFSVNTDGLDTHCDLEDNKDERVNEAKISQEDEGIEMSCIGCRSKEPVASESKDDNIEKIEKAQKTSAPPAVDFRQSCVVTFQVFENTDVNSYKTTHVATVGNIEECAYICYQNSCSGAVFIPSDSEDNKSKCKVQMREKEQCDGKHQRHYFFKPSKAVVLSCFRCQPDKPVTVSPDSEFIRASTTPRPELVEHKLSPEADSGNESAATEEPKESESTSAKPEETTPTPEAPKPEEPKGNDVEAEETTLAPEASTDKMMSLGKVTTGPVIFGGGCLITFQAELLENRPKEFTSEFELNLLTDTPEICATRCFQDGCTGALFFPKNGTCVLGYGDKQYCSNKRPNINFLKLDDDDKESSIWIHCTSCRSGTHGEKGAVTGNMKDNNVVGEKEGSTPTQSQDESKTETTTEKATEAPKTEESTTVPESGSNEEATTQAPKSSASPPGVAPESSTPAPESTPSDSASAAEVQGCLITFQVGDLSDRPKEFSSEFELNLLTETPELCATRCYQDGCTGALFFPKNGTCVLGYGDNHHCDRTPVLRFYKPSEKEAQKESLWIHCTVCRSQKHGETFTPEAEEKLPSKH